MTCLDGQGTPIRRLDKVTENLDPRPEGGGFFTLPTSAPKYPDSGAFGGLCDLSHEASLADTGLTADQK
jgi:hypothetical protein